MTAAIFGLIGVVVGAVLNAGVALLVEWSKQRADARAASRLLESELKDCLIALLLAQSVGTPHPLHRLPSEEWDRQHRQAARLLRKPGDWDALKNAYGAVAIVRMATPTDLPEADVVLDAETKASLGEMTDTVRNALNVLHRHSRSRLTRPDYRDDEAILVKMLAPSS